jgi:L-ascorbate metabolism protein UlaG (beta-lactamase superfamily)
MPAAAPAAPAATAPAAAPAPAPAAAPAAAAPAGKPAAPAAPTTAVTFHGHATFSITTPLGKVLVIDPWLRNPANPAAKDGKDPFALLPKVDYILVTHGHDDHLGDAVALAKKTGARLVATLELGAALAKGGYPAGQMGFDSLMEPGGELRIADGEVLVAMVPAVHSSGVNQGTGQATAYGGAPVSFVVKINSGPTIYHTGDTAYFRDMELIGEHAPDLALINIGGHFGMEAPAAARAAKAVKAKLVVPQHYKTFPVLTQDAAGFFKELDKMHIAHREVAPGETLTYQGNKLPRPPKK